MEKQIKICNCCGKNIEKEDYLYIEKIWGYFSGKDGERHRIYLCEVCYDRWIREFKYQPDVTEVHELM